MLNSSLLNLPTHARQSLRQWVLALLMPCSLAAHAAEPPPQCGPSLEAQTKLAQWERFQQTMYQSDNGYLRGVAFAEAMARELPNDYRVQRERDLWIYRDPTKRSALLQEREKNFRTSPNSPVSTLLYAKLLQTEDAKAAIGILENVVKLNDGFQPAKLALFQAYQANRSQGEKPVSQTEVDLLLAAITACPQLAEGYTSLRRINNPAARAIGATLLRETIEKDLPSPKVIQRIGLLLELQAQTAGSTQPDPQKSQALAWMKQIRAATSNFEPSALIAMAEVYELLESEVDKTWAEDRILAMHPDTLAALDVLQARGPTVLNGAPTSSANAAQALLEHRRKLLGIAPFSATALNGYFRALRDAPGASDEEISTIGTRLRQAIAAQPGDTSYPPPLLILADEYVNRSIHLEEVSALVDAARQTLAKLMTQSTRMFGKNEASRLGFVAELEAQEAIGLCLLAEGLARKRAFDDARSKLRLVSDILTQQASAYVGTRQYAVHLSTISRYLRAQAMLDEYSGNTPSAVANLRLANQWKVGANPGIYRSSIDVIGNRLARLEKQVASSASVKADSSISPSGAVASIDPGNSRNWEPADQALQLPAMHDLAGKMWTQTDWRGKTAVVNLWATWCGPCILELKQLEKMRAKTQDRPDIVYIAINLDEEPSRVRPFMAKHALGVQVLLGGEHIPQLLAGTSASIPQTYLVNRAGRIRHKSVASDFSDAWKEEAEKLITDMARQ